MSKRERIYLKVGKGILEPADPSQASVLRARKYKLGDILLAELTKPRNPKLNRLIHQIGKLVIENVESFAGLDAHSAIKRLQIEGRIACDEIGIMIEGFGVVIQLIPRSISFQNMDESEFRETAKGICRTISSRYWKDVTPESIEEMAELMVNE
jgi:hypothetical protein